ncbi:HNH endonuclease [Nocardioides sp. CF8]|nr:HNH endonuclease [Nocardioides sp. CF8]
MATTTHSSTDTLPETPAQVLVALRAEQDQRHASEIRSMQLAAHWVALHPVLDASDPGAVLPVPEDTRRRRVTGHRRVHHSRCRDHARPDLRCGRVLPHRRDRAPLPTPATVGRRAGR